MPGFDPLAGLIRQNIVVGVGHCGAGNNPSLTVVTYALGSCIGLVGYASAARAGGILHFMLPNSTMSPEKAAGQPCMFADTGVPHFLNSLRGLQATAQNLKFAMVGGAAVLSGEDYFKVGERNIAATRVLAVIHRLRIVQQFVGGTVNRTVSLNLATGQVFIKSPGGNSEFSLA